MHNSSAQWPSPHSPSYSLTPHITNLALIVLHATGHEYLSFHVYSSYLPPDRAHPARPVPFALYAPNPIRSLSTLALNSLQASPLANLGLANYLAVVLIGRAYLLPWLVVCWLLEWGASPKSRGGCSERYSWPRPYFPVSRLVYF